MCSQPCSGNSHKAARLAHETCVLCYITTAVPLHVTISIDPLSPTVS